MEWVETVGRSVPEALEIALDQLGVDERDAEVVVVGEAKSGLFGIGRSDARIRVRVRPAPPRPKRPQRSRRQGNNRSDSPDRPRTRSGGQQPTADGPDDNDRDKQPSSKPQPQRQRSEKNRSAKSSGPKPVREPNEESIMSVEEQATTVKTFVQGVADAFGVTATTTTRTEDNYIFVEVHGEDLGLMIGQRGATLEALQELARTVIQHRSEDQTGRVILDIAGFRAKRAAALSEFVAMVADEVKTTGVAQALEPMGAPDRKIVHDAVNEIDGVVTTSEGVDPRRYVVIRLAVAEA